MLSDPLDTLRVLRGRLGREPSFEELLQELGHAPAGLPVAGVNDPGYPEHPHVPSPLLGARESDEGLSALLTSRDLRESLPEIQQLRARIVHEMLFGLDPGRIGQSFGSLLGGGLAQPPHVPPIPVRTFGVAGAGSHKPVPL